MPISGSAFTVAYVRVPSNDIAFESPSPRETLPLPTADGLPPRLTSPLPSPPKPTSSSSSSAASGGGGVNYQCAQARTPLLFFPPNFSSAHVEQTADAAAATAAAASADADADASYSSLSIPELAAMLPSCHSPVSGTSPSSPALQPLRYHPPHRLRRRRRRPLLLPLHLPANRRRHSDLSTS